MSANRIILIGTGRVEELRAVSAITPGHLLEFTSAGEVQPHSTEGGNTAKHFATEDALQGKVITDAYAADDIVFSQYAQRGDEINALIKDGQVIAVGDNLISAGDGTLIAESEALTATTVEEVVAQAIEAIDLSATSAVDTHAAVRVL